MSRSTGAATARVLFVDDDGDALLSLIRVLKASGLAAQVDAFGCAEKALQFVARKKPEVAVIDLCLSQQQGVESGFNLLHSLIELDSTCRVIVLTGHGSVEHGIRALNAGAASFLEKPASPSHLIALINDGIKQSSLRRAFELLRLQQETFWLDLIVGSSRPIVELKEALAFAAKINQPVLILGETGTGKGLSAAVLHRLSNRSDRRLIRYQPNFSTADLVNSDLFGHQRGAFTGAEQDRRGLLLEANGGTLFLDEIDELPHETQVALLGVLQEKRFRPLGSNREEPVDFRLVCASNQDIRQCLADKKVRKDFYHRIAHLTIELPALRHHLDDIPELADFFLRQLSEREQANPAVISPETIDRLKRYNWPGNIRELQAVVESAALRAQYGGRTVVVPADLRLGLEAASGDEADFESQVAVFKAKLVREALARRAGNQVQAARDLKIDRSTIKRILDRVD